MSSSRWVLDPKGDSVVILTYADALCEQCGLRPKREGTQKKMKRMMKKNVKSKKESEDGNEMESTPIVIEDFFTEAPLESVAESVHSTDNEALQIEADSEVQQVEPDGITYTYGWNCCSPQRSCHVRLQVSSRHLCLVSPVFRAMLDGFWGLQQNSDYMYEVKASEWNAEALLIVLNVFHGRHSAVPKAIEMSMLRDIALIVDYYECHEVIEIFVDRWLQCPDMQPPKHYQQEESMDWLFISTVFSKATIFSTVATQILKLATEPIETHLPIPAAISDALEDIRVRAIQQAFDAMDILQVTLLCEEGCSEACSSMLLGALMRQRLAHGLDSSRPQSPFHGHSITSVRKLISEISTPHWYEDYHCSGHRCNLKSKLKDGLAEMDKSWQSLQIKDSSSSSESINGDDWSRLMRTLSIQGGSNGKLN